MYCLTPTAAGSGGVSGGTGGLSTASEQASGVGSSSVGIPVIRLTTGMTRDVEVALTSDVEGTIPAILSDKNQYLFVAKRTLYEQVPFMKVQCTILDAQAGQLYIPFTPTQTKYFGTWVAGILVMDGDKLISEYFCYLQIDMGLSGIPCTISSSGLDIGTIRMALMDYSKDANTLLQDFEFSDTQILNAIRRPVDDWNCMPPDIFPFTPTTFPWREPWLRATCGYLLEMASFKYDRNALPHNAGGLTMDPNNKGTAYMQKAAMLRQEWKTWAGNKKTELNMQSVWGMTNIPAFNGNNYYGRVL